MFKKKETKLFKRIKRMYVNVKYLYHNLWREKTKLKLIYVRDHLYQFTFSSEQGEVWGYIMDDFNNGKEYSLFYSGIKGLGAGGDFLIKATKDETNVQPFITHNSIMKAEEISLAIYELEKYIEDNNLERDTLEDFHISEVRKLETY